MLFCLYGLFVALQWLDGYLVSVPVVRAFAWIALGIGVLYPAILRLKGTPATADRETSRRQLAWLLQEYPALRWAIMAFGASAAVCIWWWVGNSVLPSFLGPHVFGGAPAVRIAIGLFIAFALVRIGVAFARYRKVRGAGQ